MIVMWTGRIWYCVGWVSSAVRAGEAVVRGRQEALKVLAIVKTKTRERIDRGAAVAAAGGRVDASDRETVGCEGHEVKLHSRRWEALRQRWMQGRRRVGVMAWAKVRKLDLELGTWPSVVLAAARSFAFQFQSVRSSHFCATFPRAFCLTCSFNDIPVFALLSFASLRFGLALLTSVNWRALDAAQVGSINAVGPVAIVLGNKRVVRVNGELHEMLPMERSFNLDRASDVSNACFLESRRIDSGCSVGLKPQYTTRRQKGLVDAHDDASKVWQAAPVARAALLWTLEDFNFGRH